MTDRRRPSVGKVLFAMTAVTLLVAIAAFVWAPAGGDEASRLAGPPFTACDRLENFQSVGELVDYAKPPESPPGIFLGRPVFGFGDTALSGGSAERGSFSTTNVQVEGVDEADIVKSDGTHMYAIAHGEVLAIRAYPPGAAAVLATVEPADAEGRTWPLGLFLDGDRLVVIRSAWGDEGIVTQMRVHDVSDPAAPRLVREVGVSGMYIGARLTDGVAYLILSDIVYTFEGSPRLPIVLLDGSAEPMVATDVGFFRESPGGPGITTVVALDLRGAADPTVAAFMAGYASQLYVSPKAIYLAGAVYRETGTDGGWLMRTAIHRIAYRGTALEYQCTAEVPGYIESQFSIDEYEDHLRVATTVWVGDWFDRSVNSVYVLDPDFKFVGQIEGLAPGERIYAARYMGDRLYLVTFRQVDPFFVIDLSDPAAPTVLGFLKIPGFSEYLHPFGPDHVIGVGREATDEGRIVGLKVSMFDVSDVTQPREVSTYVIRDAYSEVLYEHKAFFLSPENAVLAFPVGVYAGNSTFQGVYVFTVSTDRGFSLRGTIEHPGVDKGWGYVYTPPISRTMYIQDVLYTLSDDYLGLNRMTDLAPLGILEL